MSVRVTIEATFLDWAKRLPPDRRNAARRAIERFMEEPRRGSLDFRPLKGVQGYFIIDSVHGDRIILRRDGPDTYAAVDVGPHDNVYRRWNR
jgi:hypothetical protein